MADVRVLVAADDPLAPAGLSALLDGQPGQVVAGQSPADDTLVSAAEAHEAHVLAWDLGFSPEASIDRLADLRASLPPVVSLLDDEDLAPRAWAAGARGLVRRDSTASLLSAALSAVAEDLVVLDPDFTDGLLRGPVGWAAPAEHLTPRELEVLRLLAEGLPNKVLADRLRITENTVKFHVNAILGKLGAQTRTEAVTRATRAGLILL